MARNSDVNDRARRKHIRSAVSHAPATIEDAPAGKEAGHACGVLLKEIRDRRIRAALRVKS
jgi:hypothetical protein